jgi:hypothetical protein
MADDESRQPPSPGPIAISRCYRPALHRWACPECGRLYSRPAWLARHLRQRHGVDPLPTGRLAR